MVRNCTDVSKSLQVKWYAIVQMFLRVYWLNGTQLGDMTFS